MHHHCNILLFKLGPHHSNPRWKHTQMLFIFNWSNSIFIEIKHLGLLLWDLIEIYQTKRYMDHGSPLDPLYMLFKPWTMRSSQGLVKFVVGCWTHPGTTLINTKEKMSEWTWSSRSPKGIFKGLHYLLTWSNWFCGGRGKRGALIEKGKGLGQKNDIFF